MYDIGFTGTQKGCQYNKQMNTLKQVIEKVTSSDAVTFHHGDCIGADKQAHIIARSHGYKVHLHPPIKKDLRAFCDYDFIEPELPYLDRNKKIVEASVFLIAVSKTMNEEIRSGTWSTVRYARKLKKDNIVIFPDGTSKLFQYFDK